MNSNICEIVKNLNSILNSKNVYIEFRFRNFHIKCNSYLKDYDIQVDYYDNSRIFEPYNFCLDLKNFSLLYYKKENLKILFVFINQYMLSAFYEFIIKNQNEYIENLKDTIEKYIKLKKYVIKKCKYTDNLYCYNSKLSRNLSLKNFLEKNKEIKKNKKNYLFIVQDMRDIISERYKNLDLCVYKFNRKLSFSKEINFLYDSIIQKGIKL